MKTIKDAKKEFIRELKDVARYRSSFLFEYVFDIKEYSDYEIMDAFSKYLDELGFEDFKVSAWVEDNEVIVCTIKLKWEEKEKDSKFKLYNNVVEISRKHGVFFCDAVKKLIDANISKMLEQHAYTLPIVIHLQYPGNIKFRALKSMIIDCIPVHGRKVSRVQQIVHPEYQTKYLEIIVNDHLYKFI